MNDEKFVSMLCDRILNIPLPAFPLYFKSCNGLPVLYHFTQKLQYDTIYSIVLKPILVAIFEHIPMIHLLRNAGDLCHDGYRENYKNAINSFRFTQRGIAVALANDSRELAILESMGNHIDSFENYHASIFNANRLHDPRVFHITNKDNNRKYVFCHTARLARFKRHELLLASLKLLNKDYASRGLVLSSGVAESDNPESYEQQLKQEIKSAGITVLTGISPQEVNELLNQSYMGVILSQAEGACMAVGEYLLTGLPVLTIDGARGGRNDFLNENNAFFCKPEANSVAEGIEYTLKRKPNRQRIRDEFAKHCYPFSYRDLQRLSEFVALESGRIVGRINEKYIDRLHAYSSLLHFGINSSDIKEVCQRLIVQMEGFVIETNLYPETGISIFLRGLIEMDNAEEEVDVTSIGCALWTPGRERTPELCLRTHDGKHRIISLDNSGIFHCEIGGHIVNFVIHKL
jgi:glycosyltransferase involved in cell wall biosynthesis